MDIFQNYATCFSRITAYDGTITASQEQHRSFLVFLHANTVIHHYGINGVPLGARYSPEEQAILKGIMDLLPIQRGGEDPAIVPLADML